MGSLLLQIMVLLSPTLFQDLHQTLTLMWMILGQVPIRCLFGKRYDRICVPSAAFMCLPRSIVHALSAEMYVVYTSKFYCIFFDKDEGPGHLQTITIDKFEYKMGTWSLNLSTHRAYRDNPTIIARISIKYR